MMEALADFGTVATFGYRTLTEAIYRVWYGMFDRIAATQLASVLLLRRSIPRSVGLATAAVVIASGVFDTLANVFYVLGVQAGFASIVATGSGVYPIIPALLGITVMGERLAPNQYLGIAVLLAGLVTLGLVGG